ncbi:glucose-6-phosphate isomerase [Lingula anatina]|uniref:Glucose-6-phosphate isomerase n=1 Tax=Lingula anatina TaxID=7574 RepID=A0A1S3HX01_LINAN|nr:glucose-6-phosphate isomerase [Lingula anatina]|eukprot:XP_013389589.1 glucose-6-phosphate isomerase [Lingula anatina]
MANVSRQSLTLEQSWKALQDYYNQHGSKINMAEMFKGDSSRFKTYSATLQTPDGDLLVDFSKNLINQDVMKLLMQLAKERDVEAMRDAMFSGERINFTENRAVLHIALRNRGNKPIMVDSKDVMPDVNAVLAQMRQFTEAVRNGQWTGYTGKKMTDVVNIGIGGSDLHYNIEYKYRKC